MNTSQEMANIIRLETKKSKINISKMLSDLNLGKNVMSHLDNGSMLKAESICKIADYLDVSVDYLLGRTEEPKKINYGVETYGNNNGDIHNQVTPESKLDGISKEMLDKFEKLDFNDKVKVMSLIAELSSK